MVVAPCYQCLPPIATAHAVCTPPVAVRAMFEQAAGGKELMTATELAAFLRNVQGEKGATDADAAALIVQTVASTKPNGSHYRKLRHKAHSREHSTQGQADALDLPAFLKLLLNSQLNGPRIADSQTPTQDMTAPLSHYYVFGSHNSYLTGNQLTSKSSTTPIVKALLSGCRVIELDCWERHGKIKVLHGNTLTKAVAFEDCVRAIKENAFKASDCPVILTIENHLSPKLQKRAASVLKEIIGDMLFIPSAKDRPPLEFQSPEALKGRIIISDKPPGESVGEQIANEPEALKHVVRGAIESSSSSEGDSFDDEFAQRKEEKAKNHVRQAQDRVVEKMAQEMAKAHPDDASHQVVPKVHEFEELLYIYCAKPSEMEHGHVKGGPLLAGERAIMANLSEPQLNDFIKVHPNSLIEFSKTNLGRVYSCGLRFDSSNADPMAAWSHGMQVAAINMQGHDRAVWVARAFFGSNGACGYIKKPDFLLPGSAMEHENLVGLQPKLQVKCRSWRSSDWKSGSTTGSPETIWWARHAYP